MALEVIVDTTADSTVDTRTATGMKELMSQFLGERGISGVWRARLDKKTGDGQPNRIKLRRSVHDPRTKSTGFLFHVRPGNRDTAWNIVAYPPPGFDPKRLEDKLEQEAPPEELLDFTQINIGQVHPAKVTKHLPHGMNIQVGGQFEGYIPLADISETYDRAELNRYPIGKTVKVVITDIDPGKQKLNCSISSTEFSGVTDAASDVFTGIPNQNGMLSLKGYSKSVDRLYDVLHWLAEMDYKAGDVIPQMEAIDWIGEHLKEKYGAREIDKRGIAKIIGYLELLPEPMAQRIADPRGFQITPFGWGELGVTVPAQAAAQSETEEPPMTPPAPAEPGAEEETEDPAIVPAPEPELPEPPVPAVAPAAEQPPVAAPDSPRPQTQSQTKLDEEFLRAVHRLATLNDLITKATKEAAEATARATSLKQDRDQLVRWMQARQSGESFKIYETYLKVKNVIDGHAGD